MENEENIENLFQKIIRDSIPVKITPFVTQTLVAFFFLVYGLTAENPLLTEQAWLSFGFIPALMFSLTDIYRYVSHIFLHYDFVHLVVNSAFLWTFGDNVEEKVDHGYFALSFFICGIFAAFGFGLFINFLYPIYSNVVCIGASGAISGILAMYFLLVPDNKVIILDKYEYSSRVYIAAWFIENLVYMFSIGEGVAYAAHVFGFIAGLVIGYVFQAKKP